MMWILFVLACFVGAERRLARPRVYLGQEDINKEFPFAVSLQSIDGHRICTCSLIAQNWLITAGHCITKNIKNRRIRYGDMTRNVTKNYSKIIKTFLHPSFFFTALDFTIVNDLALMLIEKVPSSFVKLSAVDYKGLIGLPVKYAGFGKTVEDKFSQMNNKGDGSRALQIGEAVVVPCTHAWPMFGPAICVAPKCSNKLQNTRAGDSGGPLVYKGKIVGVLTGTETGEPISFYAPVSPNLKWIFDVMNRHS